MAKNERITENYVRQHFGESQNRLVEQGVEALIEEQRSANPRIQKALKSASKSGGGGTGSPEFIVSFPGADAVFGGQPLVVCECKADIKFHRSENLDKPNEYALDGVLHYASHLSMEFTVIAVAVSGQTGKEMKVDSFLVPRGAQEPEDLGTDGLLDFDSYIGIIRDREHEADLGEPDVELIAQCSSSLNDSMRAQFGFEENQRPLAVAGILLALDDQGFRASYMHTKTPAELADLITNTIYLRLKRDNIDTDKSDIIAQTYGFLRTNTKILEAGGDEGLKNLVKNLEETVQPFMRDNRRYDLIGRFYKDFLKFANGDGGLGIVLTPQHITELFVELAEIHKDSVVVDICCGTGGFLISAMEKMETLAKGNRPKISDIHEHQLVGVESNTTMFCLACSNMMLRGDGKANIFQSDCFRIDKGAMTRFKPTVALLNPPYSVKQQAELAFVELALDMLEPNGKAVAIVPISCVMTGDRANSAIKERILEKHTLTAVMSMPPTLFYDSRKNAVTCIMVFEAHKPHTKNSPTWFADWKDDGFKETKRHGRIDADGLYENTLKAKWLDSFFHKKEIPGFSVIKQVGSGDEWLVEACFETDFSSLADENFVETLLDYTTFLYSNKLIEQVSSQSNAGLDLSLNYNTWQTVRLSDLFTITGTRTTTKDSLEAQQTETDATDREAIHPYVTTQSANNGVRGWYGGAPTESGGVLTIDSAAKGFCAYQPLDFFASDHVEKLEPNGGWKMTAEIAMFLATVINFENYRYSYGRKMNQKRIAETEIKLPHNEKNKIDWVYIESYIKGLPHSKYLDITP